MAEAKKIKPVENGLAIAIPQIKELTDNVLKLLQHLIDESEVKDKMNEIAQCGEQEIEELGRKIVELNRTVTVLSSDFQQMLCHAHMFKSKVGDVLQYCSRKDMIERIKAEVIEGRFKHFDDFYEKVTILLVDCTEKCHIFEDEGTKFVQSISEVAVECKRLVEEANSKKRVIQVKGSIATGQHLATAIVNTGVTALEFVRTYKHTQSISTAAGQAVSSNSTAVAGTGATCGIGVAVDTARIARQYTKIIKELKESVTRIDDIYKNLCSLNNNVVAIKRNTDAIRDLTGNLEGCWYLEHDIYPSICEVVQSIYEMACSLKIARYEDEIK